MAKELDPDTNKDDIERLCDKQAAALKELHGPRPALTQQSVTGHTFEELESQKKVIEQKLVAHNEAITDAQELEKRLASPARAADALDREQLAKAPEAKAMLESASWNPCMEMLE
ncbi:unnamed protein product, partial [Prorocentrum cordatum]